MPANGSDVQPGEAAADARSRRHRARSQVGCRSCRESRLSRSMPCRARGNWADFVGRRPAVFGARRKTSCTQTSTATSATRCPACCRFETDSTAQSRLPGWSPGCRLARRGRRQSASGGLESAVGLIVTANNEVDRALPFADIRLGCALSGAAHHRAPGRFARSRYRRDGRDSGRRHEPVRRPDSQSCRDSGRGSGAARVGSPCRRPAGRRVVRSVRGGVVAADIRRRDAAFALRSFLSLRGQRAFCRASRDHHRRWTHRGSTIGDRRCRRNARATSPAEAADAVSSLRARFGDRSNWRWTEIHAVKFSHPLAGVDGCLTGSSAAARCLLRATT